MTKLQITISDQEANLLAMKGSYLGYDVTKYVKHVLAKEAEEALRLWPTFQATSTMERLMGEAEAEDRKGVTKKWKLGRYGD